MLKKVFLMGFFIINLPLTAQLSQTTTPIQVVHLKPVLNSSKPNQTYQLFISHNQHGLLIVLAKLHQQSPILWSIEIEVEEYPTFVALHGNASTSNLILLSLNKDHTLQWLGDSLGNRTKPPALLDVFYKADGQTYSFKLEVTL